MKAHYFLCLAVVLMAFSMPVKAESVTLTIVDGKANPLPNAVVIVDNAHVADNEEVTIGNKVVDQVNRQFTPFMTVIKAGSEITFPNSDNIRHHVYSFSEPKPFELKLYANEEKPTLIFDKPGVVTLGCNIHDQMIAHIVITKDESAWVTDDKGEVTINVERSSESPIKARLWHPLVGSDLQLAKEISLDNRGPMEFSLDVEKEEEEKPESRLEQRFNRTGSL